MNASLSFLAVAPEPATLILLLVGFLALTLRRKHHGA
ncbi:MAG: PEP-CTERM sorting domain-containing protein [Phycisphaerales bacterium]|nr:PEP-CTERM sorting domain-containing protein [Phycisphaerales bacterium]